MRARAFWNTLTWKPRTVVEVWWNLSPVPAAR